MTVGYTQMLGSLFLFQMPASRGVWASGILVIFPVKWQNFRPPPPPIMGMFVWWAPLVTSPGSIFNPSPALVVCSQVAGWHTQQCHLVTLWVYRQAIPSSQWKVHTGAYVHHLSSWVGPHIYSSLKNLCVLGSCFHSNPWHFHKPAVLTTRMCRLLSSRHQRRSDYGLNTFGNVRSHSIFTWSSVNEVLGSSEPFPYKQHCQHLMVIQLGSLCQVMSCKSQILACWGLKVLFCTQKRLQERASSITQGPPSTPKYKSLYLLQYEHL